MKYYKVVWGYQPEEYIPIDETELEKALYAHISGKVAIFKEGSINGSRISVIAPDVCRAMGWNRGYKLTPEDYEEFDDREGVKYAGYLAEVKDRVNYLINSGKTDLIGKNTDIKLLK